MKKVWLLIVAALMSVMFVMSGCGNSYSNGLSSLSGTETSNGGFAVVKGDYVYFINGVAANTDANDYGKVETGALVRVKKSDLANAKEAKTEMVIPSLFVAGDKTSGFSIYDDTVYFASPTTARNKEGTVENSKLDFVKANLNGANRKVLKTVDSNTTAYRFTKVGGTVYLVMNTVDEDSNSVMAIYNMATGAAVKIGEEDHTAKIAAYIFPEEQDFAEMYYTKLVYNENTESDEKYHEIHRLTIATGKDEVVLSGAGLLIDGQSEAGLTGSTFTLLKDTKDSLFVKADGLDTSLVTVTRYYDVAKQGLVELTNGVSANNGNVTCINHGTKSASTVFGTNSYYESKNAIFSLDSTYGITVYNADNENNDDFNEGRIRLFHDADLVTYTVKFWNKDSNGNLYLYLVDSDNYYYRVNVSALYQNGSKTDAEGKVEKVNFLANSTSWYLPEVIEDKYFLSVYTASPYNSFVYVADMEKNAALTDEEIETIRKAEKESVQANIDTCISLLGTSAQETLDKYMEENFKD